MTPPPVVSILGAGLAGSLCALFLKNLGFSVNVYEKRQDPRSHRLPAGRSINLALANRGLRALHAVGLEEAVNEMIIPMRGRLMHSMQCEKTFQSYGQREDEVIYSVPRSGLNQLLINHAEKAGVQFFFEMPIQSIVFDDRTVTVGQGNNITVLTEGPFIAADGAGSLVRQAMTKQLGYTNQESLLDHVYKELTIPANEDGSHKIRVDALHIWPRGEFMMIALPNQDGTFTVTLFIAQSGETGLDQLNSDNAIKNFFSHYFPDAIPLMPEFVSEFKRNPSGVLGTVRAFPWHKDDFCLLLGDSAHAIVPFHGQGMNAAFEDCWQLSECIKKHNAATTPAINWKHVFEDYEIKRKPNTEAIADMALENYVEMRDSVRDQHFLTKKKLAFQLEKKFPNTFVPRYSRVMFHHEPYASAQANGLIQDRILETLLSKANDQLEVIDFVLAGKLIEKDLKGI